MSVYTQSRRLLTHTIPGRSLTGFGPAAAGEKILKAKQVCTVFHNVAANTLIFRFENQPFLSSFLELGNNSCLVLFQEHHIGSVQLYTPPYILGNMKIPSKITNADHNEHCAVMFCGYCLSEDQRYVSLRDSEPLSVFKMLLSVDSNKNSG